MWELLGTDKCRNMNHIISFFTNLTSPRSLNEDRARREFILNVLLLGALCLLSVGILIDIVDRIFIKPLSYSDDSLSSLVLYAIFMFFFALYALSRKQRVVLSSYLLLGSFFALAAYMGYVWGVDVSASLLFYALTIVMAGILIHTRVAFVMTILAGITIASTVHMRAIGLVIPNRTWTHELWRASDITVTTIIFLVIATVAWLSNREIEKSLKRARRSEATLTHERDMLEVRVTERTQELRQAEMEKMSQAYHFVEFGRLASGIFHDLINPLAALSLNIDHIAAAPEIRTELADDVQRAKRAANHMQELLDSMRRHLTRTGTVTHFSLRDSLSDTLQVLSFYARSHAVRLTLDSPKEVYLYGDPVGFTQVMTNLIGNAVHAYPKEAPGDAPAALREVVTMVTRQDDAITIRVRDYGSGIAPEALPMIFEPFFTTKKSEHGIGLGLSLAKRIVEKDFGGTLTVDSVLGEGSIFTVYLPVREP